MKTAIREGQVIERMYTDPNWTPEAEASIVTVGDDGAYSDELLPGKANVVTADTLREFPNHEKPEEVPNFVAGMVSCAESRPLRQCEEHARRCPKSLATPVC